MYMKNTDAVKSLSWIIRYKNYRTSIDMEVLFLIIKPEENSYNENKKKRGNNV